MYIKCVQKGITHEFSKLISEILPELAANSTRVALLWRHENVRP